MTARKKRVRVAVKEIVTDELVKLFRAALPADRALDRDRDRAKPLMTVEQTREALAAISAFQRASGHQLWERHSALSPDASGEVKAMQDELIARLPDAEAKAWRAYCRRYWKRWETGACVEEVARKQSEPDEVLPRPELRWSKSSGGW